MRYRDFEEFLASLNAHGVRYLVVGAHAVAFHARPRATHYLSLDHLIAAKESADRDQDRADLEQLRRAKQAR